MPTIDSLTTLLINEVRDLYDAEKRLTVAMPRMAKKATNRELRVALNRHLRETKGQVRRLEQVFRRLGESPRGKACLGMRGIVEEGNEHLKEEFEREDLRDATIIGAWGKVEHYEMASYIDAIEHAGLLGQSEVQGLLQENLREEQAADKTLRALGQDLIDMTEPVDGDEESPGARGRKRGSGRKRGAGRKRGSKKR